MRCSTNIWQNQHFYAPAPPAPTAGTGRWAEAALWFLGGTVFGFCACAFLVFVFAEYVVVIKLAVSAYSNSGHLLSKTFDFLSGRWSWLKSWFA